MCRDTLGRQVNGRNYPPTNKNTLIRALTEEWDNLPQQLLDNVVQSMVESMIESTKDSNEFQSKVETEVRIPDADIYVIPGSFTTDTPM
ncbi:hypothetical protein TNCV_1005351 [Trichonephila clavipes]|nr:hypothetical protein TNCV_1005351 [Trichonephila clavipes]